MRVVHIHTDLKFVSDTSRFFGDVFENDIVLISNKVRYDGQFKEKLHIFRFTNRSVRKIVEKCVGSDMVVLYGLDSVKSKIVKHLPDNIPLAWRFFGSELYQKDVELCLSERTLEVMKLNGWQKVIKRFFEVISKSRAFFRWGNLPTPFSSLTVNRINFFLGLCREEYEQLLGRWPQLPPFVRLSVPSVYMPDSEVYTKEDLVLIGNNRSSYNNNLDIIDIIEENPNRNRYQFALLFSYGSENSYSSAVREKVKGKEYFKVIDEFMPLERFNELYQGAGAAVFNGYRQMALGNIFLALKYGVKLYLNDRNIIKEWLSKNGLIIKSVEDLSDDLDQGTVTLTEEEEIHNSDKFKILIETYTDEDFQKVMLSMLRDKSAKKR